jgi:catechol 2,3-dioxygenase-like lactoylglutathione lyase family enzyme
MEGKLRGVHHIALVTRNVEESVSFYRDLLGFTEVERFFDEGEEADIVFLSLGNTLLELLTPRREEVLPPASFHLAFAVEGVEEVFAELVARGVPVVRALCESHGFHYAYFRGPMGEIVEIVERKCS